MHNTTPLRKRSNKIIVHFTNNRLDPALVMVMRKNRSNILNPDKRLETRNNAKVALRMGD